MLVEVAVAADDVIEPHSPIHVIPEHSQDSALSSRHAQTAVSSVPPPRRSRCGFGRNLANSISRMHFVRVCTVRPLHKDATDHLNMHGSPQRLLSNTTAGRLCPLSGLLISGFSEKPCRKLDDFPWRQ
jgi:hypothetical protein